MVTASADLEMSARRIAMAKFFNAGQTCLAPNHCYVPERLVDMFVEELRQPIGSFYGPDPRTSPDLGRIVNETRFDDVVDRLGWGEVVHGGRHDRGDLYVEPTILRVPPWDDDLASDELLGPVLGIRPYSGLDEVVRDMRRRPKPTRDLRLRQRPCRNPPGAGTNHERWRGRERSAAARGEPSPSVRRRGRQRVRRVPREVRFRGLLPPTRRASTIDVD